MGRLRFTSLAAALLLASVLAGCGSTDDDSAGPAPSSTPSSTPSSARSTTPSATGSGSGAAAGSATGSVRVVRTVTSGLDVPWGIGRLPDGQVLLTTRDDFGLYRLDVGTGEQVRLGTVPGVLSQESSGGEGGLLGLAVSPSFDHDHRVYLYWSTADDNRIGYVQVRGDQMSLPTVIVSGIPHGLHHNGGRLAFGPDGYLYAGTGESEVPELAQDKSSLGGKILRMTTAGEPAPGNPFGTLVYSYGHRNVQGLAFDADGRLFASEFGESVFDELNLIRPGNNYGWPMSQGQTDQAGITSPIAQWGTEEDSPSGIAIADGAVWMAALAGQRLWRIPLDGDSVVAAPTSFLDGADGRLRSVLTLDQHHLLVTTSNRDGRATPGADDDRVLLLAVS